MILPGRTALVAGALALVLSGCSGDDEPARTTGVDPEWYSALEEAVADAGEIGEVPTLKKDDCPLGDPPVVAGEEVEEGAYVGVSTLGDSGHRLICQWSPPATDLIVSRFDEAGELELARDEVSTVGEQDNGANVQVTEAITVGERDFFVRRTVFPTNDSHIDYAVWHFDDDNAAMVLLEVETTDTRDLITSYDAQQAAEDLAALLDGS